MHTLLKRKTKHILTDSGYLCSDRRPKKIHPNIIIIDEILIRKLYLTVPNLTSPQNYAVLHDFKINLLYSMVNMQIAYTFFIVYPPRTVIFGSLFTTFTIKEMYSLYKYTYITVFETKKNYSDSIQTSVNQKCNMKQNVYNCRFIEPHVFKQVVMFYCSCTLF